jgi:hypothetical protein
LVRLVERKRIDQDTVYDAEYLRNGPDAERHGEDGRDGKARLFE